MPKSEKKIKIFDMKQLPTHHDLLDLRSKYGALKQYMTTDKKRTPRHTLKCAEYYLIMQPLRGYSFIDKSSLILFLSECDYNYWLQVKQGFENQLCIPL